MYDDPIDPDDPDAPQPIDLEGDDEDDETRDCPHCGRVVRWDAPRCPHCEQWIVGDEDSTTAARARGWFWPIMVAILIAVVLVIWNKFGR